MKLQLSHIGLGSTVQQVKALSLAPEMKCQVLVLFTYQPTASGIKPIEGVSAAVKRKKKQTDQSPKVCSHSVPSFVEGLYQNLLAQKAITGKTGELVSIVGQELGSVKCVVFLGLGADEKVTPEGLRQIGGQLEQWISSQSLQDVLIHTDSIGPAWNVNLLQGLAEGLALSGYRFKEMMSEGLKKQNDKSNEKVVHLNAVLKNAVLDQGFREAIVLAECVNFSKRLGDMPSNHMTPTNLGQETISAAKGTKLKVQAWDKARIRKEKMGGLLGINQGSTEEPRFIYMEYKGGKTSQRPLVFVGKGLTFDTGGISIKPSAAMEEMKYDMCGGANVIGTMLAIAKLGLKINVIGLVPSTDNMPSGSAIKPGDVVVARNGKTIEVNNTDAEGRVILADALSYATELKPVAIIDAATLTGAMVVALGNTHTGYFTKHEGLKTQIEDSAKKTGESVWNMPLCDFHTKDIKGTFADLSNISATKGAGSATAAAFLEQFVGEGIPWVHFDIAGTGWAVGGRLSYCTKKGASGVMVRTFVEIAKQMQ